jgi:transporter family protein
MSYLHWTLAALLAYSFMPPLVKAGTEEIPSTIALLTVNGIVAILGLAIVFYDGESLAFHYANPDARFLFIAGLFLTVALFSFYRALSLGPVSVVVPIFAIYLVISSVIGITFFDEVFNARKGVGIALAVVAIYLTSS